MSVSHVPWWLELAQEEAQEDFVKCELCGTSADSVDVVCARDDTALVGGRARERQITVAAYVLRALVVLAALAIGYLRWAWPAYVVGVVLAFAFALLFVRNHRISLIYFAVAGVVVAAGHGLWAAVRYPHLGNVVWSLLLISILTAIAFIARMTILISDKGVFPEIDVTAHTVVIASTGIVASCAGVLVIILGFIGMGLLPQWLFWGATRATPVIASIAVFAILVSGVVFTLGAPAFKVDGVLHYREVLAPVRLGRFAVPDYTGVHGALQQLAASMERIAIRFANGLTSAVETAYNRFRGLINGFVHTLIICGNAVYRWAVKTGRHIARVLERCLAVTLKCLDWCWILLRRFYKAFVLPVFLSWVACAELWWIAHEIRAYVLHETSWMTPLLTLMRIIITVVLLSMGAMFMLEVRFVPFGSKLSAAAGVVGGRAFLFFVFIAWTLGLFGWATDGPFRIGWLTLTSTGMVITALIALRARRAVAVAST